MLQTSKSSTCPLSSVSNFAELLWILTTLKLAPGEETVHGF
jgi:hypothetical protein